MEENELSKAIQLESKKFEEFYLWLQKSMPPIFFQEVKSEWISLIVHQLMNFKLQDYAASVHLKNAAIYMIVDSPIADVTILENFALHGIKNYTTYISRERLPFDEMPAYLRIATIYFTDSFEEGEEGDKRFLRTLSPDLQATALELLERAKTRDLCQYSLQMRGKEHIPSAHLILAWKNAPHHNFLYRIASVVYRHNLVMHRVNAAYIAPYSTESVLLLSFGLHGADGREASSVTDLEDFLRELLSIKYFGSKDLFYETFVATKLLTGNHANFLRAMMNFIHQVLAVIDPHLYSLENIGEALQRHPELTIKLVNAFEHKFNPQKIDLKKYDELLLELNTLVQSLDTGHEFHDSRRRNVLLQGINFVKHLLKTTFYRINKSSLVFRLDPKYLDHAPYERKKHFPELPYAVFFFKGMHYIGFHVRFKDLARGGLRTVMPERKERVLAERNTVFLEVYNLAYTQHKKNKDIPEGGAKGVIFLKPDEHLGEEVAILRGELEMAAFDDEMIEKRIAQYKKEHSLSYLYETQRSYVKNFLSLVNCDDDGTLRASNIVDYWKKPEYIYLGPDENMFNPMIEWIAEESKRKGYKPGGAFISGKPSVGINHKEYGVTSLGVNVYMREVLRFLKKNPEKESFTVKMTGGPDGDVAGNQIHNLYKYYPKTAKLIALTDVSGTIFDPQGLDLKTCVELFKKEQSIRFYPPEKLNFGGFLLDRERKKEITPYTFQTLLYKKNGNGLREEWLSGSEMNALFGHNVHKTYADIFIPCGGRPKTLRESNVVDFLDEKGKPTSLAIIEGANLYLTQEARRFLEEKGVIIIKDSSANKCGVISSSFEILSGLTLSDSEFLENKPEIVRQILERLEKVALDEALLLLRESEKTKKYLTEISDEISKRINHYTDELLNYFDKITLSSDERDPFNRCFYTYCLKILREKFHAQLKTKLPQSHKKAIIASHIASRLVYSRGLEWSPALIDILPLVLEDKEIVGE